jgi:hypothetical protein
VGGEGRKGGDILVEIESECEVGERGREVVDWLVEVFFEV